jgi:iron complex transport system ATP-binding protein
MAKRAHAVREVVLAARSLTVEAGRRCLVRELSFELAAGELLAVLGCNGSGKTLTLHTLAGLREPRAGSVLLEGAALAGSSRRSIALRIGMLTQDSEEGLAQRVLESVLIGRHPHLKLLEWERAADRELALACLARVGLSGFAERSLPTLSGGEQRRASSCSMSQPITWIRSTSCACSSCIAS